MLPPLKKDPFFCVRVWRYDECGKPVCEEIGHTQVMIGPSNPLGFDSVLEGCGFFICVAGECSRQYALRALCPANRHVRLETAKSISVRFDLI